MEEAVEPDDVQAADGPISTYAADLDVVDFCREKGWPVRAHPFFRDMEKAWPAVLCELRDATVLGEHFVPVCDGQLLGDNLNFDHTKQIRKLVARDGGGERRVFQVDRAFLLGGDRVWGHFVVFYAMRVLYLQLFQHLQDVPVITMAGMPPSIYEILNVLGCPRERLILLENDDAIVCNELYAPTICGGATWDGEEIFISKKFAWVYRDMMLAAHGGPHPEPPTEAVYVLRRNTQNRLILNDDEVARFFEARGYRVIEPAAMPLREQVELAQRAKFIVSCWGSQIHIADFAQPGAKMIAFMAEEHLYQRAFAPGPKRFSALGLSVDHILCEADADDNLKINLNYLPDALSKCGFPA